MQRGTGFRRQLMAWTAFVPVAILPAASGFAAPAAASGQAAAPVSSCAALAGLSLPAQVIGLPSRGVHVNTANLTTRGPAGDLPQFCLVHAEVLSADRSDPPIQIEVNLPDDWNRKAVQFGGGGFDGFLVTALTRAPHVPNDVPVPLAQGFATYGGDSGHSGAGFDGRFGTNDQALANYSGESVKRTHDAAFAIIALYYGQVPRRSYHVGGSKGGHEGLVAAQRYGTDYDGVIAYYPAAQNQAMVLSWYTMWKAAYGRPGAALDGAKQALLKKAIVATCDGLDGAHDGIVSDPQGCGRVFAVNNLRCPGGNDTGDTCLSDAQIDAVEVTATPLEFAFPLKNGVTNIGPYPLLVGGDGGGTLFDPVGVDGTATAYYRFFDQVWKYFDAKNDKIEARQFNYRDYQERVLKISSLFDTSSSDLDTFRAHGGKLIVVQGTADMLVTPSMTAAYVDRVRARYGPAVQGFLRYYLQPGFGHGQGDFQLSWDSLAALDSWVEAGAAPVNPIAIDEAAATKGRSRPLCEGPAFPVYNGQGDLRDAKNYSCTIKAAF